MVLCLVNQMVLGWDSDSYSEPQMETAKDCWSGLPSVRCSDDCSAVSSVRLTEVACLSFFLLAPTWLGSGLAACLEWPWVSMTDHLSEILSADLMAISLDQSKVAVLSATVLSARVFDSRCLVSLVAPLAVEPLVAALAVGYT